MDRELKITRREAVRMVLDGKVPPYTPWSFKFTTEAREKLTNHFRTENLDDVLQNHILGLGDDIGIFEKLSDTHYRDVFGVIWDRSVDKDIGNISGCLLPKPSLKNYRFPDPHDNRFFDNIQSRIDRCPDMFRVFEIGFSLFERAWSMRGLENLMTDFLENPHFVNELLTAITDYNISHIEKALEYDIDAVHFGDDWGQQRGLIMGRELWRDFIKPHIARMYSKVKSANKYVSVHSCGDVHELLDDLIEIGVDCFNPFQPEVMDVPALLNYYRGKISFYGGLSTQKTLPYGTPGDVKKESEKLLNLGRKGSYIFSPAHAVEGDVTLDNMLAFIEQAQSQIINL